MRKYLLFIFLFAISLTVHSQTYNPAFFTTTNKSLGVAQNVPTDARSQFYDATNFVMRDYSSKTEVLTYLNLAKYRQGHFPVYIHNGGALSSGGVWFGGTTDIYVFKDSTDINSLVDWNTVQSVNGRTGAIMIGNADTLKGKFVDTTVAGSKNNYLLAYDSITGKWKLTPPAGNYTQGTGILISGNTISADNTTALWNANAFRGRSISTTPPTVGSALVWNGVSYAPSSLNGLDTAYLSNDTLYLVNTFDTIPVDLSSFSPTASNGLTKVGNDIRLGGNLSASTTLNVGNNTLDIVSNGSSGETTIRALNGSGSSAYMAVDPGSLGIYQVGSNPSQQKSLLFSDGGQGMLFRDTRNSIGTLYDADYSANGLSNPRWLPDIAAVRKTINDSLAAAGGYIKNDTIITQNGGFKLGTGSKVILDTANMGSAFTGNRGVQALTSLSNLRKNVASYIRRDTLDPALTSIPLYVYNSTGYNTVTPAASTFNPGINVGSFVHGSNTKNWLVAGYPSTSHPSLSGVYSTVGSVPSATGSIPKSAAYFGTFANSSSGLSFEEVNLLDITYDHSNPTTVNHANGIRIADYDMGNNGTGIYMVLGDGKASPLGRWGIYDSVRYMNYLPRLTSDTMYVNHFAGYKTNVASNYTNFSFTSKRYVDSSISAITGATNLSYTQNALNNVVNSSTGTGATLLPATQSLAGLLDTGRVKSIDSLRFGLKALTFNQGITRAANTVGLGGTYSSNININTSNGSSFTIASNGGASGGAGYLNVGSAADGVTLNSQGISGRIGYGAVNGKGYIVLRSQTNGGSPGVTSELDVDSIGVNVASGILRVPEKIVGGTTTTDSLVLSGTTANPATTSTAVKVQVGNNGATNAMTILNNGMIGIGNTTPQSRLVVARNGASITSQFNVTGNTTGDDGVYIGSFSANTMNLGVGVRVLGGSYLARATNANMLMVNEGIGGFSWFSDSALTVGSNYVPTERMRLTNDGKLGIGTIPGPFKLNVAGSVVINKDSVPLVTTLPSQYIAVIDTAAATSGQIKRIKPADLLPAILPTLTSGSVLFSNGTTIAQDNTNFFWDNTNKRLGIGNGAPANPIDASGTMNTPFMLRMRNLATTGAAYAGIRVQNSSSSLGEFYKASTGFTTYKTVSANDLGFYNQVSGNISVLNDAAAGNINLTAGGASTPQLLINPLGQVGIGIITPLYGLHVNKSLAINKDSTTTTTAGATRMMLVSDTSTSQVKKVPILTTSSSLDFPSVSSMGSQTLTVSLTGAVLGDGIIMGIPNASKSAGLLYGTPWVSSANTISVEVYNLSLAPIDPSIGTFNFMIIKQQ